MSSIATELDNLNTNILNAYTAISNAGGTVPADKNTDNLSTAIASISGGGPTYPKYPSREMPDEWKYFTSLKNHANDQAYLFCKGLSNEFIFQYIASDTSSMSGTKSRLTVYGGSDGITPLYRSYWNGPWQKYDNGSWVQTQAAYSVSTYELFEGDKNKYYATSKHKGLSFADLQGKPINDPVLGSTELFTVIIEPNPSSGNPIACLGVSTDYPQSMFPLIAYSGGTSGLKVESADTSNSSKTPFLEFVEFTFSSAESMYQGELAGLLSLTHISFPSGYTGAMTPLCYTNISDFTYPSTMSTTLPSYFLSNNFSLETVTLPSTITDLPTYAFQNCKMLKEINLNKITSIGNNAFSGCYSLEEVDLSRATSIGSGAFTNNYSLSKITLGNNLTSIADSAFRSCNLRSITIPESVTSIGANAFQYNYNLKSITLPSGLTSLGTYAFQQCKILDHIDFPNGITTIPGNVCNGCWNLRNISFGNAVTQIDASAFANCSGLTDITLPNTLVTIGSNIFQNCIGIRDLTIPANVTTISANAFNGMSNCACFKMLGNTPTLSAVSAFAGTHSNRRIFVPYEYFENYYTASNWNSATNNIQKSLCGFKTFNQGDSLPSTTPNGTYEITWYEDKDAIINSVYTNNPRKPGSQGDATPITEAPSDGEFYFRTKLT